MGMVKHIYTAIMYFKTQFKMGKVMYVRTDFSCIPKTSFQMAGQYGFMYFKTQFRMGKVMYICFLSQRTIIFFLNIGY